MFVTMGELKKLSSSYQEYDADYQNAYDERDSDSIKIAWSIATANGLKLAAS